MVKSIFRQCLEVKFAFIVFQCVVNWVLPDHQSDGFISPSASARHRRLDSVVTSLVGGLARWDAQYLLHVASHGYTHENTLAFLPALPALIRLLAAPAGQLLSLWTAQLLTAVLINWLLSAVGACLLYQLGVSVLRDSVVARCAALLFCVSPASVFFMAPYTESLFCVLGLCGMLLFENKHPLAAAAAFCFASVTRSNGICLVGFFLYNCLLQVLTILRSITTKDRTQRRPLFRCVFSVCLRLLETVCLSAVSVSGFVLFQLYAFVLYCTPRQRAISLPVHVRDYLEHHRLVYPGYGSSSWCDELLPFSYGYVQSHYWNVGFLRYLEWRQLPNFIIAAPCALLVLYSSIVYFRVLATRWHYGLQFNYRLVPYVVHAVFLTCYMFTCAHVQVTTRVLCCSCPLVYWAAAWCIVRSPEQLLTTNSSLEKRTQKYPESVMEVCTMQPVSGVVGRCVQFGFCTYAVLGITLFVNNLPWT